MKQRHPSPTIPFNPSPPQSTHRIAQVEDRCQSSGPQQADHGGIHQSDLLLKPRSTGLEFATLWLAVTWRPTFERIAHIEIPLWIQASFDEELIEQSSRTSNKGASLLILRCSRSFTDQHQRGRGCATTDHHPVAATGELTSRARAAGMGKGCGSQFDPIGGFCGSPGQRTPCCRRDPMDRSDSWGTHEQQHPMAFRILQPAFRPEGFQTRVLSDGCTELTGVSNPSL